MPLTIGELQSHYRDVLAGNLRWWQLEFPKKTQRVLDQLAARGVARSGFLTQAMTELAISELRARNDMAIRELKRIVQETGSTFSADELKQAFDTMSPILLVDIRANLLKHFVLSPNPEGAKQQLNYDLTSISQMIDAQAQAELGLFARTQQGVASIGPQINVHGPVGAIQTGSSSFASVTVNDVEALKSLVGALNRLGELLASGTGQNDQAARELVEGAKAEAATARPSAARLQAMLLTLATTIQTAGAIEPAYHAVKAAAQSLGIQLP